MNEKSVVHAAYAMYGKWGVGISPDTLLPDEDPNGQTLDRKTFQEFAVAELTHPENPELDSPTDKLVRWRMNDPRFKTRAQLRRDKLQRQFTIDLRCDFTDANKNQDMETTLAGVARHLLATAMMLSDGQKPEIAVYTDDAFTGHKTIALLDDTIVQGSKELGLGESVRQDTISQELYDACNVGPEAPK